MLATLALVMALGMVPFASPSFWGVASGSGHEAAKEGASCAMAEVPQLSAVRMVPEAAW